jgi:hypothetical protein
MYACITMCRQFNAGLIGYLNCTLSSPDWPPSDICYIFNHYSALPYSLDPQMTAEGTVGAPTCSNALKIPNF